jgi:hypothetical protein
VALEADGDEAKRGIILPGQWFPSEGRSVDRRTQLAKKAARRLKTNKTAGLRKTVLAPLRRHLDLVETKMLHRHEPHEHPGGGVGRAAAGALARPRHRLRQQPAVAQGAGRHAVCQGAVAAEGALGPGGAPSDLQAVFDLVLRKAAAAKLPAEEMPERAIIVSDMEFDSACERRPTWQTSRRCSVGPATSYQ